MFLAAMSSSRSDGVTHFVLPFVRNQGVFCSHKTILRVIGIKTGVKLAQKEFMVTLKVQGCIKGAPQLF